MSPSSGARNRAVEVSTNNQNFILTIAKNTQLVTFFCGYATLKKYLVHSFKKSCKPEL
jgi:hypothetical protein